jgi:hypothetical protein
LCTIECRTDADCQAVESGALCASLTEAPLAASQTASASVRHCVQGCAAGSPNGPQKCQGRSDMACRPFQPVNVTTCRLDEQPFDDEGLPVRSEVCPEGTFCLHESCQTFGCGPRCNADDDCQDGRACNPRTGLCDSARPATVPVGASCDDNANSCGDGACLVVQDSLGGPIGHMCSQTCTIGGLCGDARGACLWPRFQRFAAGDIGYCMQLCDCETPCANAQQRCLPLEAFMDAPSTPLGVCDYAAPGAGGIACEADAHSE